LPRNGLALAASLLGSERTHPPPEGEGARRNGGGGGRRDQSPPPIGCEWVCLNPAARRRAPSTMLRMVPLPLRGRMGRIDAKG